MPTVNDLMTIVDQTYRNSYQSSLKISWMDTVQRQIFQKVPKEAAPFFFTTVADFQLYPFPTDCDRHGVKEITIETAPGSERFTTLEYLSIESNVNVGAGSTFYSIQQNMFFLNPKPTSTTENKKVCVLYNKRPATLSSLSDVPELEEDFHELLVLGCLERIARARGEIDDKNNFAADYNGLLADYERQNKLRQPEYYRPKDVMPRRRGQPYGGRRGNSSVADLIPPGL